MIAVLVAHVVMTVVCAALVGRLGPKTFLLAALAPASGVALLAATTDVVTQEAPREEVVRWVPGLDLEIALRLDPLAWLMLILVCGVGTAIFVYTAWYAHRGPTLSRLVWTLTAFAGAMAGLVLADDVVALYVFWELTTVTSFVLIGLEEEKAEARRAARQSLLITVLGGLSMLVGLLMLANLAGTSRISQILATPPSSSTQLEIAVALILVGAITKSAQAPFHIWLPGAMAAPTPVSAYLHAAAMVKAGIYLVARLSPAFADLPWWRPVLVAFGLTTMILGGYRALRFHDLKSLLAFSTVSQLGFLMVVAAWGTPESAVAFAALLLAHGFAKAALFMTIGIVDHAAHTRDLRRLDGLGRAMPVVAGAAGLAAASMAGIPLLLGFIAKEEVLAAIEESTHAHPVLAPVTLAGLVVGSVFTLAYSLRLWWGAFARKSLGDDASADFDAVPHDEHGERLGVVDAAHAQRQPAGMVAPVVTLAALSLLLGTVPSLLDPLGTAVGHLIPGGEAAHYALWHGVNLPLLLSLTAIALGAGVFAARARVGVAQNAVHAAFTRHVDVESMYDTTLRGVRSGSAVATGATQTGSLPRYLGTIMVVFVTLPVVVMSWSLATGEEKLPSVAGTPLAANAGQGIMAVFLGVTVLWLTRTRRRLAAILLLGSVGYGISMLFIINSAPDLALTQLLVETLSVVLLLMVLRLLPHKFPAMTAAAGLRAVIAVSVGLCMAVFTLLAASGRTGGTVAQDLVARSYPEAHGRNIVNVILVDFRGFDTFGEISVVFAAAVGIGSLILTLTRSGRLPALPNRRPRSESVVLDAVAVLLLRTVLVLSLYFLFAGHNSPGGGFIGGLTAGLAYAMLYLAGGVDLERVARMRPRVLLGVGLAMSGLASAAPWFFGQGVLESSYFPFEIPLLGQTALTTVLVFDTGVFLIVVGLALTILTTLGAQPMSALAEPAHAEPTRRAPEPVGHGPGKGAAGGATQGAAAKEGSS